MVKHLLYLILTNTSCDGTLCFVTMKIEPIRNLFNMSNATHHPFVLLLSPKINVALKITIEFLIYHSWVLIQW
jgi:hypothetical protein